MSKQPSGNEPPFIGDRYFATTHWSVVLAAGRRSSLHADEALAALCQTYWYPLYAYVRRRVPDPSQAQDLTQSFFAELLAKNFIRPATPERGRFRAYLLTAFKHFLSHEWQKAKALKRGGSHSPVSLDFDTGNTRFGLEPCVDLTADELFDRQWAISLLDRVMDRLRCEFDQTGKTNQFLLLKDFMIGSSQEITYAEAAFKLGTTAAAAKMTTSRMRRRFRELLHDEIAQTVGKPEDIQEEIRDLFAALER